MSKLLPVDAMKGKGLTKAERRTLRKAMQIENSAIAETDQTFWRRDRPLSERQKIAVKLLSDFVNNFSIGYIAAKCMVEPATIRQWRNQPEFIRALDLEVTARKTVIRSEAFRQLFRKVKKGDMRALRLYFEVTGDLNQDNTPTKKAQDMNESEVDEAIRETMKDLGIDVLGEAEPA